MNININEDPIREKHISWYTEDVFNGEIALYEVVLATYRYPQEDPTLATINQVIIKYIGRKKRVVAPTWVLLEAAQNATIDYTK